MAMGASATPMLIIRPPSRKPPKADAICTAELVVERTMSNPPASRIAVAGSDYSVNW